MTEAPSSERKGREAMTYNAVGKPIGRVEGPAKVTGAATYSADIRLPSMIWGKALRSPLPHARIVHIDTSAAERLPGVLAVLTAKDLPDLLIGRRVYDMPVLAKDRVRFIGEKVAIVAAEDPDLADEALAHIEVEYEELPAVFDAQEAMKPDAPVLHPQYRLYPHAPAKYFSDLPNVHSHVTWQLGDVEQGFAAAAQVFEHTFTTHYVHQGYIEPHASVVAIESDGRAHVWLSNKMPFRTRELLADAVQIPLGADPRPSHSHRRRFWRQGLADGPAAVLSPGAPHRAAGEDGDDLHRGVDGGQSTPSDHGRAAHRRDAGRHHRRA